MYFPSHIIRCPVELVVSVTSIISTLNKFWWYKLVKGSDSSRKSEEARDKVLKVTFLLAGSREKR